MWGPPPLPPPLPPAAITHQASHCGWRLQKGQDYWERAFQSLGEDNQPITQPTTPPATTASAPPTDNTTTASALATPTAPRQLEKHEEASTDTYTMDTSTNTKLSTIYYQTRNTRRAHNTTTMHNIGKNTTHLISNTHIGSFDTEHKINNNFLASGNDSTCNIHQNISLSFDPKNMQCIFCNTTHNITHPAPDTLVTYVLSDQNFPPGNSGGGGFVHLDSKG